MFGNPVVGYIAKEGSVVEANAFRVTSTFAEHVASGRGPGVDIGNGACGAPVFAMNPGRVTLAGLLGTAKVVRIMAPDGVYETGYAHLATILVKVGQVVIRGQQVGTLGATGATACHLHIGLKKSGVEVDSQPLWDQTMWEGKAVAAATATLQADIVGLKARLASIKTIAS